MGWGSTFWACGRSQCLIAQGYVDTTTRVVCKLAGVSHGSLVWPQARAS
jgi:hypothetical protein